MALVDLHRVFWLGMAAVLIQTLVVKGLAFASHIIGSWFLHPYEYGAFAVAQSILMSMVLVCGGSLRDPVLAEQVDEDALGMGRMLVRWVQCPLVVAVACFAGVVWYFDSGYQWIALLLGGSIAVPLFSLAYYFDAVLRRGLQFRRLAVAGSLGSLVQSMMIVALAIAGWGAWSLVAGFLALGVAQLLILWRMLPSSVPPSLIPSSAFRGRFRLSILNHIGMAISQYGDYVILLVLGATERLLGLYFLAFILADQAVRFVVPMIRSTLLPVLARAGRDGLPLEVESLERKMVVGALLLSVLQVALAPLVFEWLLRPDWSAALVPMQFLSCGVAARVWLVISHSRLMGSGRFFWGACLTWWQAGLVFPALAVGYVFGSLVGASLGLSIALWLAALTGRTMVSFVGRRSE